MTVEWRMSPAQRNQTVKVCSRVWEALQELAEDNYDEAMEHALLQVQEKLESVLPFGPETLDVPNY